MPNYPTFATQVQVELRGGYSFGENTGDIAPEDRFAAALEGATAEMLSIVPARYRNLFTEVPGEALKKYAVGTEGTFTLGLEVADISNLLVFKNFASFDKSESFVAWQQCFNPADTYDSNVVRRTWGQRVDSDAMDSSEYTLTGQELVLNTALSQGDSLVVTYDTDITILPQILNEITIRLVLLLVDISAFAENQGTRQEQRDHMRKEVDVMKHELQAGTAGIPEFDDLVLVEDWISPTDQSQSAIGSIPINWT